LDLLLDTQVLVWLASGDRRLTRQAAAAIDDLSNAAFVSAVTAAEYVDLQVRGRFPLDVGLGELLRNFALRLADFPGEAWRWMPTLPPLHRDPVDRMLVAHALAADMTIISADAMIRRYPVRAIW
jgi:PIN domain nuclease of toxin-antitoxin system